jgi:Domain of unknown function (DUF4190)
MGRVLHSTSHARFDYRKAMFALIPEAPASRSTQSGGPPPRGWGPPGPGGYGPPGPGGYGPPGPGGYGPPAKPITGSAATMALHAMTIDPKTGLPRGEKPPASTAAVVALVCGILLCLGPFTGIPAIIAGVIARKAARRSPQTVGGAGMGLAGILLGALNLLLSGIAILIAIWQVSNSD